MHFSMMDEVILPTSDFTAMSNFSFSSGVRVSCCMGATKPAWSAGTPVSFCAAYVKIRISNGNSYVYATRAHMYIKHTKWPTVSDFCMSFKRSFSAVSFSSRSSIAHVKPRICR